MHQLSLIMVALYIGAMTRHLTKEANVYLLYYSLFFCPAASGRHKLNFVRYRWSLSYAIFPSLLFLHQYSNLHLATSLQPCSTLSLYYV